MKRIFVLRKPDGVPGGDPTPAPAAAEPDPTPAPAAAEPDPTPGGDPAAAGPEPKLVPVTALTDERKKRQEAERAAQAAREQLAYMQGMVAAAPAAPSQPAQPQQPAGPPVEPRAEDFESFEDFQLAERRYVIDLATFNATQTIRQEYDQHTRQQSAQQTLRTFQDRLNKAAELDPDITTIAQTFHLPGPSHIPLTQDMQGAILESEVGPQLLRYFANNRNEATRLSAMSPVSALREIGRIEAGIINKPTPPVKHVTAAPEPIKPVGGGGATPEVDEDTIPMSEYMARERARKAERQQRR